MYWLAGMFGALALIDISLELTRIRKLMERRLGANEKAH